MAQEEKLAEDKLQALIAAVDTMRANKLGSTPEAKKMRRLLRENGVYLSQQNRSSLNVDELITFAAAKAKK